MISISSLLKSLENDPYLIDVLPEERPKLLASVYILTGCDYTSFFVGCGKTSFLNTLFNYAEFICQETEEMPGSLTSLNGESGFMSFLRLVGAAYFQTHRAAFRQHADPRSLFNSLKRDTQTPMEHHEMFIDKLRQSIWDRVVYEDNLY